jgi:hypothetical protein
VIRVAIAAAFVLFVSCSGRTEEPDPNLASMGESELTGELVEIPAPFPPNDLYNYAYVMKYRVLKVHRGSVAEPEILVAHYNPLKPRPSAADDQSGKIGGRLDAFRAGEVHRMALTSPADQHWMGGVVDKYFETKGVRYWALWTNPGTR